MPARRLTSAEFQECRAKGLCFYCDEKYTPGHRCTRPQLFLLDDAPAMEETTETTDQDPTLALSLPESSPDTKAIDTSSISFHALSGLPSPSTLRFQGTVNGTTVQVLLDNASTHHFVQPRMVTYLNLLRESAPSFGVMVGNGDCIYSDSLFPNVNLTIQGTTISVDFHTLELHGSDFVLGVEWLATLGPVMTDYSLLIFKFIQH